MLERLPTRTLLTAAIAMTLAACGGGGDDPADPGAGAAALKCDTTLFVAGTVATPTLAQLAPYAGTYDGDEGTFGPNPGDPFVKSGTVVLVLGADGVVSYKGTAITVTSVCIDKAANGLGGIWLYVHSAKGHVDVTDKATAHGISLIDGAAIFQNGKKR